MINDSMNVNFVEYVSMFLENKAVKDADFKAKYENPAKQLNKCIIFIQREILNEAEKNKKENAKVVCAMPSKSAVLDLAVRYYTDDDIIIEGDELDNVKVLSASATTFSDEEKAQMRQEAIRKYQDDVIAEQKKKDEERRNKLKAKAKKATTPVLVPDVPQNGNVETPTPQEAPKAECVQMDLVFD